MNRSALMRWFVIGVLLSCGGFSVFADYGIMPVTTNTLLQWQADQAETPDYELPSDYVDTPRDVNLLTNVTYEAKIRDQGHTGSCWMWGCQAVMWLDYARQYPVEAMRMTNGFSVQFISSYLWTFDTGLNEGGTPQLFKKFFDGFDYAVSWCNTNAAWTDGKGYVATPPSHIYTTPNVPIHAIELQDINTFTASVDQAKALLKSVLDSGRAMHFNLMLADEEEWDKFMSFWGKTNDTEETIFTNFVSGKNLMPSGGAHMMACVGYNDTDPDPSKHYWLFLNSWSTGDNHEDTRRPHGTWRLPMNMDYGSYVEDFPTGIKSPLFDWGILDTAFTNQVQKNFALSNACLSASEPAGTIISFTAPVTAPGVISNLYRVVIHVNDRYFDCKPGLGTWTPYHPMQDMGVPPKGDLWLYRSTDGSTPAITLLVDIVKKTWNCEITDLGSEDCRFIDLHDGLRIYAEFMETPSSQNSTFCSHRCMAYDELSQFSQQSGSFSSPRQQTSFTFITPTNGAQIRQGDVCVIEWEQQGLDNMLVYFCVKGYGAHGENEVTIIDQVPVINGRCEWQVPMDIRCVTNKSMRAVIDPDTSLTYNGPDISIIPSTNPVLYVRAPVSDELWMTGAVRSVSWEGLHLTGDMIIELLFGGEEVVSNWQVVSNSAITVSADAQRTDYHLPEELVTGRYALRFSASGLVVTSGVFSVTSTQRTEKAWTIMVYFDADNDLEAGQIRDFLDIARTGSSSNVNVLVQMDRIPGVYIGYDNWYTAKRYYMTNGITPTIGNALTDVGEISAANPGTYTDFINWGVQNYPAQHYLFIMCDHGEGWSGALYEMTPNADFAVAQPMTTFERGISNAVAPMDIVGYDTCNMAEIQAAYQLRNTGAGLFIGSQYMETMGWAYSEFLRELNNSGGEMTPRALSTRICELSAAKYAPINPVALSAIALDRLEPLAVALSNAALTMIESPDDRAAVRARAAQVASNYYPAIVHFAANQQTERINSGLNIYFPANGYRADYATATLDFKAAAGWPLFLNEYTNHLADTWIGDARALSALSESADTLDIMRFFNNINPPDDAVWVSVSMVGRGEIDGVPLTQTIAFRKGDVIQLAGRGLPAESGQFEKPATHFVRWWSSAGATFSNELIEATNSVTLTDNAVIIGYFSDVQSNYTVTVSAVGNGSVNGMTEDFEVAVVSGANTPPLFAVPDAGYRFAGWGGDMSETANPLIVSNVIANLHVIALFWAESAYWSNDTDVTWWQAGMTNFTLSTPQQLAGLAQVVNNGTDTFNGKCVLLGTNLNLSGKEWTAIGNSAHPYAGSFNGQGFTINGLTLSKSADDDYQGLFGSVSSTGSIVIERVHLTNTSIIAGGFVGGIAGQVESLEGSIQVRDCSNDGTVWGYGSLVGGLVGELMTGEEGGGITVSNGLNGSRVNGTSDIGGLVGRALAPGDITVTHSSNAGDITAEGVEIGGIVGSVLSISSAATLDQCLNTGAITAEANDVGGIAGKVSGSETSIIGCHNNGTVTITGVGHEHAGGVAGTMSAMLPRLANCFNQGEIHGENMVGGVVGLAPVSVQNSSNEGRVEGDDRVGGVAGAVQGSSSAAVENCLNAAEVISTGRVGAIAGQIACENASSVSSAYFLKTADTNAGLSFVGEMIPSTSLTYCATFTGLDGELSTAGYSNKTILVNALNAWVSDQTGAFWWSTNRDGTLVYPWPDASLTEGVVTFRANGGLFVGGADLTNKVFTLGRPYGSFPNKPSKTNNAFVGWWYIPEPGVNPTNLVVDLTALPSVTSVDAWWSTTVRTATPLPVSVEKLAEFYPGVATMTEEEINALANGMAANGRDKVWELIFLGLNPTDPGADPAEVFVYITGYPIQIHTVPETPIHDIPQYVLQGKENITDAVWVDLGQPGDLIPDNYHFFRVIAE